MKMSHIFKLLLLPNVIVYVTEFCIIVLWWHSLLYGMLFIYLQSEEIFPVITFFAALLSAS